MEDGHLHVAVSHRCTYKEHYPKELEGSEHHGLARLEDSHQGSRFPRHMWHHQDLGQIFCQACKAPCPPNKEDVDCAWGLDKKMSMEDLKKGMITAPCLQSIN